MEEDADSLARGEAKLQTIKLKTLAPVAGSDKQRTTEVRSTRSAYLPPNEEVNQNHSRRKRSAGATASDEAEIVRPKRGRPPKSRLVPGSTNPSAGKPKLNERPPVTPSPKKAKRGTAIPPKLRSLIVKLPVALKSAHSSSSNTVQASHSVNPDRRTRNSKVFEDIEHSLIVKLSIPKAALRSAGRAFSPEQSEIHRSHPVTPGSARARRFTGTTKAEKSLIVKLPISKTLIERIPQNFSPERTGRGQSPTSTPGSQTARSATGTFIVETANEAKQRLKRATSRRDKPRKTGGAQGTRSLSSTFSSPQGLGLAASDNTPPPQKGSQSFLEKILATQDWSEIKRKAESAKKKKAMDPHNVMQERIKTRINTLAASYGEILDLAMTSEESNETETALKSFKIRTATHAMISSCQDLLKLTNEMKDAWVFGQLDTVGAQRQFQEQTAQDTKAVVELLGKIEKLKVGWEVN